LICIEHVICSVEKLLYLAEGKCREEDCNCNCSVSYEFCGCCISIKSTCQKGHIFKWESSHSQINNNGSKVLIDNLDFALSILLSGNNFRKIQLLSNFFSLHLFCFTTYHTYQKLLICPTVDTFYKNEQVSLSKLYTLIYAIVSKLYTLIYAQLHIHFQTKILTIFRFWYCSSWRWEV